MYPALSGTRMLALAAEVSLLADESAGGQRRSSVNIRHLSNVQLVRLCARKPKNELAWDEFVRRFNQHITLFVIRAFSAKSPEPLRLEETHQSETIRDLVQDVYLRLLENERQALRRFHGYHENSIYAYLARIATTVVLDHQRQASADKRTAQTNLPVRGLSPKEHPFNERVTIADLTCQLDRLLEGEHKQRDILIFLLHVVDGLTTSEIASQPGMGLTQSGVESVLRRIKLKLREATEADQRTESA